MATITTRAVKGSALTHSEMDANFNNLNSGRDTTTEYSGYNVFPTATRFNLPNGNWNLDAYIVIGQDESYTQFGGSQKLSFGHQHAAINFDGIYGYYGFSNNAFTMTNLVNIYPSPYVYRPGYIWIKAMHSASTTAGQLMVEVSSTQGTNGLTYYRKGGAYSYNGGLYMDFNTSIAFKQSYLIKCIKRD